VSADGDVDGAGEGVGSVGVALVGWSLDWPLDWPVVRVSGATGASARLAQPLAPATANTAAMPTPAPSRRAGIYDMRGDVASVAMTASEGASSQPASRRASRPLTGLQFGYTLFAG